LFKSSILVSKLRDILARLAGTLIILGGTMTTSVSTTQSLLNGPVGSVMNLFCWDPDTYIKLQNGTFKQLCEISVGNVLSDNSIVTGHIVLDRGEADMYEIDGIKVAGDHLVLDISNGIGDRLGARRDDERREQGRSAATTAKWKPVCECIDAHPIHYDGKILICLTTNTGIVKIGKRIFRDFEEINSPSIIKSLQQKDPTGTWNSGFFHETLIMTQKGKKKAQDLLLKEVLIDGSQLLGICTYVSTEYVEYNGIKLMPDTLIGDKRAQHLGKIRKSKSALLFHHLLTTSNKIMLTNKQGLVMWIADDTECNDVEYLNWRTNVVLKHLNN